MHVRLAAVAALVAALAVAEPMAAAERLSLGDAIDRVASTHPALRLHEARSAVLAAERDRAALAPPLVAGLELENGPGTGQFGGFDRAEITLTLASVLERGGKLDARRVLAQGRIDAQAVSRETARLDLLAEVARRYLTLSSAGLLQEIAATDVAQRQRTLAAARARLAAGASPEAVVFSAEAALARAELALERAALMATTSRQQLAALWGERDPAFEVVATDPLTLPAIADQAQLAAMLERTQELAQFADQRRIGEARMQLARASTISDLEWHVGIRRHEAGNDLGLVAGISLPLGTRRRAEPELRMAGEELALLSVEREAAGLSLYATLVEAHGRYLLAASEVQRLGSEVLPALVRAEAASERAYRAGASSYLEWAQVQSEFITTRRQQLEVAIDAQRALIEIQRLTGQPMVAGSAGEPSP
jgi:cobalt-zinc-cadmium efflux system outer membrane protein